MKRSSFASNHSVAHPLAIAALALGVLALAPVTGHCGTLLRGEVRTCRDYADLDHALERPQSDYFNGWTTSDFDAAQRWIASCMSGTPTKQEQERQDLLAARRQSFEAGGQLAKSDATLQQQRQNDAQQYEQQKRDEAAAAPAAAPAAFEPNQAEIARHDACLQSRLYLRYMAAARVSQALQRQLSARQMLAQEQRVQAVSGTVNLNVQHEAGRMIVTAEEELQLAWLDYKRNGGPADSPQNIPPNPADPCGGR